jgi:hypothetical protein
LPGLLSTRERVAPTNADRPEMSRDNFAKPVIEALARRVGYKCSNPHCGAPTVGPATSHHGSINVGVAAHITAASGGGPRYDATLEHEGRRGITNGICAGSRPGVDPYNPGGVPSRAVQESALKRLTPRMRRKADPIRGVPQFVRNSFPSSCRRGWRGGQAPMPSETPVRDYAGQRPAAR